jgi:16S rRNA (cytidine1402-2'-O)-methyltransferase
MSSPTPGRLFCVATPIGNLGDITLRALEILRSVDTVACEDTRTAGRLLAHLDIRGKRFLSYHDHNEARRAGQILALLHQGQDVALISEAGTPTISDPGYRIVSRCAEEGVTVVPVPGACAAIAALCASGLPTDRFLFLGFPPKKGGKLRRFLDQALEPQRTAILYLPMRRLPSLLEEIAQRAPLTRAVVARELTKIHEQFARGTVTEILDGMEEIPQRGECTLLLYLPEGADDLPTTGPEA